jgi:hypothetical protein
MSLLHRRIALAGAGLAAVAITALTVPSAAAKPPTTDRVQAAAGWLATQFVGKSRLPAPDGDHFDESFGGKSFPNYGANADAIFGLAAAKVAKGKADVALNYLVDNIQAYTDLSNSDGFGPYDGSIGKLAVAAIVAGRDPAHLGGHDLIAKLHTDECAAASVPGPTPCVAAGAARNILASISESFVILAEARAGDAGPTSAAVSYFLSLQCATGGFTSGTTACGSGAADIDATSYAIMALTALGGHPAKLHHATVWLRSHQHAKGYWVIQNGPNVDSTGLAAAALKGAGAPIGAARHWLRAQQIRPGVPGAGAFRYGGKFAPTTRSATSPSVLATAQALTGLADDGSLATLTAAGSTHGSTLYPPAVRTPAQVPAGTKVKVVCTGFAAGEQVSVEIQTQGTGQGAVAFADPSGMVTVKLRLGHAYIGTHTIKVISLASHFVVKRPITVTTRH